MTREIRYQASDWIEDLRLFTPDASGSRQPYGKSGRLEEVAQDVVIAKADAVSEVMILLAALRVTLGRRWNEAAISCGAAQVQKTKASSSIDFSQQAAHLLPGNVIVNNKNSWDAVLEVDKTADGERLSAQLEMAFACTMSLPSCFNVADSRAEMGDDGLKKALAEATIRMGRGLGEGMVKSTIFDQAIGKGLELWFSRTNEIYLNAAAKKASSAKAANASVKEKRLLEARVLAEYARSFKVANPLRHIQANPALRALLDQYRQRSLLMIQRPRS